MAVIEAGLNKRRADETFEQASNLKKTIIDKDAMKKVQNEQMEIDTCVIDVKVSNESSIDASIGISDNATRCFPPVQTPMMDALVFYPQLFRQMMNST